MCAFFIYKFEPFGSLNLITGSLWAFRIYKNTQEKEMVNPKNIIITEKGNVMKTEEIKKEAECIEDE